MLDVGCATGYARRAFEGFGISYTGVEFEPAYLEIAREWFAGADGVEFIEHDIIAAAPPKTADIVIASAMLEHLPTLMPALGHLADGARQTLLLRTFLGESEQIHSIPSPVAAYRTTHRKFNNRYSFPAVLGYLENRGFQTRVVRDRYTDSAPQWVDGVVRTFYVVEAQRNGGGRSANGAGRRRSTGGWSMSDALAFAEIGIMQGRLSPPEDGRIQPFPTQSWREEFARARKAGLASIEWIYEAETEAVNPLGSDRGIEEVRAAAKGSGVGVGSVCADYYMSERLVDQEGVPNRSAVEHLRWLLGRVRRLGARHVVLPFVDSSSLRSASEVAGLLAALKEVIPMAEQAGVEIHLETDLLPR